MTKEFIGKKMKKVCILLLLTKLFPSRPNIFFFLFLLSNYITGLVCHLSLLLVLEP